MVRSPILWGRFSGKLLLTNLQWDGWISVDCLPEISEAMPKGRKSTREEGLLPLRKLLLPLEPERSRHCAIYCAQPKDCLEGSLCFSYPTALFCNIRAATSLRGSRI